MSSTQLIALYYIILYYIIIIMARKPLVGPGLFKKLCPFVSVKDNLLPILDLQYSCILINTIFPSQFQSSNSSYPIRFGVEYFFYSSIVIHTHQVPCPWPSFNFDVIDNDSLNVSYIILYCIILYYYIILYHIISYHIISYYIILLETQKQS